MGTRFRWFTTHWGNDTRGMSATAKAVGSPRTSGAKHWTVDLLPPESNVPLLSTRAANSSHPSPTGLREDAGNGGVATHVLVSPTVLAHPLLICRILMNKDQCIFITKALIHQNKKISPLSILLPSPATCFISVHPFFSCSLGVLATHYINTNK